MSTKHMTLLLWYGETAGVKVNRRYAIDSGDKFKDFFGARRTIEEGVWKQTDEKVLVGSKAYDRMSADARQLILKSDNVILPPHAGWPSSPTKRNHLKRGAFALNCHNEARIDIESMDFQPIEERVAAMMVTGHAGTLSGRWPTTKVNEPERGVTVYDRIHNQLVKHEEECLVNAAIKEQTDTSIAVRAANERHEGKLNTFRKQFGSCPTCTAGICTQRCVK